MSDDYIFTSESITRGHPDKLCDQISDAIMARYLRRDRMASVIAECAISTGIVFVAARVAANANIDIPATARDVIMRAGYDHNGFDVRNCTVMTSVTDLPYKFRRTPEEEMSEEELDQVLVQDQATVFGYACDHTEDLMPLPIRLAHKLARRISEVRRETLLKRLVGRIAEVFTDGSTGKLLMELASREKLSPEEFAELREMASDVESVPLQ